MAAPAPFTPDTHSSFVALLAEGNQRAWVRLDRQLRPYLARCLQYWGVADEFDRDDLLQETLIQLRRALHTYRGGSVGELWSWAKVIARRKLLDSRRGKHRTISLDTCGEGDEGTSTLAERLASPAPSPEERVVYQDLLERVSRAVLGSLGPKAATRRAVWSEVVGDGASTGAIPSGGEIASRVGTSAGAVAVHLCGLRAQAREVRFALDEPRSPPANARPTRQRCRGAPVGSLWSCTFAWHDRGPGGAVVAAAGQFSARGFVAGCLDELAWSCRAAA
ncbi:MAG: sigma-70 family RNA polymerase sigma factor [Candidatus Latescibacterota bacterium]